MHQDFDPPAWLPPLSRAVQALGSPASLSLLCAAVWIVTMALAQGLVWLLLRAPDADDRLLAGLCASVCSLAIALPLGRMLVRLVVHVEQSQRMLTRHATLDSMTGIFNRRHFLNLVEREWSLARRYDTACALVLIDVDHFRKVNEGFGHLCGDLLLRRIAEASAETLRQADVLARFGGEEFILFLPHTDPLGALDVAERIRERVEALNFAWNGRPVQVSVSLGVAALHAEHIRLDQLIHEADEALQVAKTSGRNCVRACAGLLPGKPSRILKS
ncbi:GGDEF domain-containing protein [Roseateles violae]|uniref:diguanylate cyclase n=1 Tax=Roseateles violae TaxID=3058042 RepID=A0ABT8DQH3_9BURK|nr:GGDEF domain-containing protein [Pelomonas sp. PFR6]MDN3920605.1 GGDEF domain-containing protein [Pelomonas sp. PFR6]